MEYQGFLLFVPVLLLSFTGHEYAHARVALSQGDDTPLRMGRVTWNPLKHIDPIWTIVLPAILYIGSNGQFVYGGAKPVITSPANYRNYRRGDILVSLAGVGMNLVIAVGCVFAIALFGFVGKVMPPLESSASMLQAMALLGLRLNFILVVFNLIPLPPLDGSHVFKHFLPRRVAFYYTRYAGIAFVALMLATMIADSRPLASILGPAIGATEWIVGTLRGSILPSTVGWLTR